MECRATGCWTKRAKPASACPSRVAQENGLQKGERVALRPVSRTPTMNYRIVNGTVMIMHLSGIVAIATGFTTVDWTVAIMLCVALILPAIALRHIVAILNQQQEQITQLAQVCGHLVEQSAFQADGRTAPKDAGLAQ
jgi:hypothetical protein